MCPYHIYLHIWVIHSGGHDSPYIRQLSQITIPARKVMNLRSELFRSRLNSATIVRGGALECIEHAYHSLVSGTVVSVC